MKYIIFKWTIVLLSICCGVFLLFLMGYTHPVSKEKVIGVEVSRCASNMKEIHEAFYKYSARFDHYPPSLDCLVPQYLKGLLLKCPTAKFPDGYEYLAGSRPYCKKWELFPILRDKKGNHPGAVNVLMSDQIVITVPDNDIEGSITKYIECDKANKNYIPFQQRYPPEYLPSWHRDAVHR